MQQPYGGACESSCDQSSHRCRAVRHHVRAGSGDAHEQCRGRGDGPKLGQSVRYVCGKYRCWWQPDYYYGYAPSYYTWYGYAPGYRGFWW